jgi:hypothetical protein
MNTTLLTVLQLPLLADGEESIAASAEELSATQNVELPALTANFPRLLDEAIARLSAPGDAGVDFPDDEIHRDILLPLLPAMLGDAAIREHWAVSGIAAREWVPDDFEIPVTASYHASPDARALADTLLAEPSFRELCAALLNQLRITPPVVTEFSAAVEEMLETAPVSTDEELPVEAETSLSAVPSVDPFDALLARLNGPGGVTMSELLAEPELLARLTSSEGERLRVIVLPV